MVECRHCRRYFRDKPEHLGARCPSCRMPLYERVEPAPPPLAPGAQTCLAHSGRAAMATCGLCRMPICTLCRTRWHNQPACPTCVEKALAAPEGIHADPRFHRRQALWAFFLGVIGWGLLLAGSLPFVLMAGLKKEVSILAMLVILLSFVPSLFALGQGAAAVRARGDRLPLAATGLTLSGAQIGVTIGLLLLIVWAN